MGLSSCDAIFDNMEGDLSKMTAEDMLSSDAGIQRLLANLYGNIPMSSFSTADQQTLFANASRSTPDYSIAGISTSWDYTAIRSINKFIEALAPAVESGIITEDARKSYEGEALAIRAYMYFANVRRYGGIPIVEKSLDDQYDGGENAGLYYKRLSEKDSWDWVINQFQVAADLLPETNAARPMAITKYAALGLKARAALWAASESKYWKRAGLPTNYEAVAKKLTYMDESYADDYYKLAIEASAAVIKSGKYELVGQSPASIDAAIKNFEDLFQDFNTKEGLLGRSYKTGAQNGNGTAGWVHYPFHTKYQAGTYSVTLNLADEYDNYDNDTDRNRTSGKVITNNNTEVVVRQPEINITTVAQVADYKRYDKVTDPFTLKDARFQAWVIYPGSTFRGKTVNIQGGMVTPDGVSVYPTGNPTFALGDKTYYAYGDHETNVSSFYNLLIDLNAYNTSWYSFMIKKFVDLKADSEYPQSSWYDLRYSEILLTYAEATVENNSGHGDKALAKQYLNDIRHRAGFKDNVDLTIENVLHEWKVEFAFENKWQSVLYRRRGYLNTARSNTQEEGTTFEKLTLIPLVDLTGTTPKYIFLRAEPYSASAENNYYGTLKIDNNDAYYLEIPNYVNNKIENNNKVEDKDTNK